MAVEKQEVRKKIRLFGQWLHPLRKVLQQNDDLPGARGGEKKVYMTPNKKKKKKKTTHKKKANLQKIKPKKKTHTTTQKNQPQNTTNHQKKTKTRQKGKTLLDNFVIYNWSS